MTASNPRDKEHVAMRQEILNDIALHLKEALKHNSDPRDVLTSLASRLEGLATRVEKEKLKRGQTFFRPLYTTYGWSVVSDMWTGSPSDDALFDRGDVYLTRESCQARIQELEKMMGKQV